MPKWPHTKRYTRIIFRNSFLWPFAWCDLFCFECQLPPNPPPGWLEFLNCQSKASLSLVFEDNTPHEPAWKTSPWKRVLSFRIIMFEVTWAFWKICVYYEQSDQFLCIAASKQTLFLMSGNLRPKYGASTVSTIALNPAFSALLTRFSVTFLSL